MNRFIVTIAATVLATGSAWANCDASQGMIDLDRCPVERAQLEREARAMALADVLCRSTSECNALGTSAFKTGNWRLAIHYFEQQASHAEEVRDAAEAATAYHNAALAHIRGKSCLDARDWLDAAAVIDPQDKRLARHERLMKASCSGA